MSKTGEIVDISARNKPNELSLSEYEPYITQYDVKFTTPDNTTYKYRMSKSEYKNLLSYFGYKNGEYIIEKNVPLKKSNYGWEIDTSPYYKRGNKLLYNIRRFFINKNIYTHNKNLNTYTFSPKYRIIFLFINAFLIILFTQVLERFNLTDSAEMVLLFFMIVLLCITSYYITIFVFRSYMYLFPR